MPWDTAQRSPGPKSRRTSGATGNRNPWESRSTKSGTEIPENRSSRKLATAPVAPAQRSPGPKSRRTLLLPGEPEPDPVAQRSPGPKSRRTTPLPRNGSPWPNGAQRSPGPKSRRTGLIPLRDALPAPRSTKSGTEIPENPSLDGGGQVPLAQRSTKSGTEIPENPAAVSGPGVTILAGAQRSPGPKSRRTERVPVPCRGRRLRALNEVRDRNPGEPSAMTVDTDTPFSRSTKSGTEIPENPAAAGPVTGPEGCVAQRSPGPKSRRTGTGRRLAGHVVDERRSTKSGTEIPENRRGVGDIGPGWDRRSTKSGTEIPENRTTGLAARRRSSPLNEVRDRNPGEPGRR